jgi:uncharacterized membrane protein
MTEDLPPLKERYGAQLDILEVDATQEEGGALYRAAIKAFQVPSDRYGVPALFIGNNLLVGSGEIPEKFPDAIANGLKAGGIDWPVIPGLANYRKKHSQQVDQNQETPIFIQRFLLDPVANTVAVVVLLGMVASIIAVGVVFLRASEITLTGSLPDWVAPVLCILGLFIAGYLSYVEIAGARAICGPVGDCNAVQSSRYAKLWGFFPVAVLGIIGYVGILAAWLVKHFGSPAILGYTSLAMWALALLGTLFMIYLTFLEPFVIGSTCAWCITNAIVITLLMWFTTRPAVAAAAQMADEP